MKNAESSALDSGVVSGVGDVAASTSGVEAAGTVGGLVGAVMSTPGLVVASLGVGWYARGRLSTGVVVAISS